MCRLESQWKHCMDEDNHSWTREGKNVSYYSSVFQKAECNVKGTTGLSLSATLPRQTVPGWAIAATLQEHRLIGMFHQNEELFHLSLGSRGWNSILPDVIERISSREAAMKSRSRFQEDTWLLQAFLGHTPRLLWIAVTTQSFTRRFCWTNPEFPPWPAPEYAFIYLTPCTTPHLSLHIPFAPAAKGSAPATHCQQHFSDLQRFPNQLPWNV